MSEIFSTYHFRRRFKPESQIVFTATMKGLNYVKKENISTVTRKIAFDS